MCNHAGECTSIPQQSLFSHMCLFNTSSGKKTLRPMYLLFFSLRKLTIQDDMELSEDDLVKILGPSKKHNEGNVSFTC